MQTQYFVYALEVEKTGSITQAAENLYMTQPTLSKAIRDLEGTLGFSVFNRSSRGVMPTYKGAEFLRYARKIVTQMEQMELALQAQNASSRIFSLAIPRVSYMSQAAAQFTRAMDKSRHLEIDILEASSMRIIDAVAQSKSVLGLVRYNTKDEEYFTRYMVEKGLRFETVWQADYLVLMGAEHPLAAKSQLTPQDLTECIEIAIGDEEIPYIGTGDRDAAAGLSPNVKRILVHDRATLLELLQTVPNTYCLASAQPGDILKRHSLVQRCILRGQQFKDMLICRAGYRFSAMDRDFIDLLYLQRNAAAYGD